MKYLRKYLKMLVCPSLFLSMVGQPTAAAVNPGVGGRDKETIKRDGPVDTDSWDAQWIWEQDNTTKHNWVCFRKTAELSAVPAKAQAKIACDTRYWLWVNGELVVYEGSVKRGPNGRDTYFDTVELAPYLTIGKNTIAVLAWYFGDDSASYSSNISSQAGFLFEADLGGQKLFSDGTWKVHREDGYQISTSENDPGSQPNYRLPEGNILYDAVKSQPLEGWQQPGFDDSAWAEARTFGKAGAAPWNGLWQRPIPLLQYSDILPYKNPEAFAPYQNAATTREVHLGMQLPVNSQLQPWLKVEAPAGLRIQMLSDGDSTVRTSYLTKEGVQEFEGLGWMTAQTLTYVVPAGVRILDLGYRHTGYQTTVEGAFHCEDPYFNQLWQESLDTLYITMRDNYMDCPDRERAQWWGDVTNESQMTFYSLAPNSYLLYRKGVDSVLGWRGGCFSDDRVLCTVVPISQDRFELPMQQLAGVIGFWTYYLYTGERDFLEQVYQPAVDYLHCWSVGADGLVNHRGGSWDWMDWGDNTDEAVMENAWYYWACQRVMQMAETLQIDKDRSFLLSRMETIKASYPALWNGKAYYKHTENGRPDDRGNALAVLSGLAAESQYESINELLKTTMNASPYMEKYVMDAMFQMGYDADALARMKIRYHDMMADQWTTLHEMFPTGGTHNHAWSGGPMVSLSGCVAGIAPDTPGYDTYHVIPQLGSLNDIQCVVPSIKGDITVNIKRDAAAKTCKMELTSPAGTTARVAVPGFVGKNTVVTVGSATVFENGRASGTAAGVQYLTNDQNYIYFEVQPGTYTFSAYQS